MSDTPSQPLHRWLRPGAEATTESTSTPLPHVPPVIAASTRLRARDVVRVLWVDKAYYAQALGWVLLLAIASNIVSALLLAQSEGTADASASFTVLDAAYLVLFLVLFVFQSVLPIKLAILTLARQLHGAPAPSLLESLPLHRRDWGYLGRLVKIHVRSFFVSMLWIMLLSAPLMLIAFMGGYFSDLSSIESVAAGRAMPLVLLGLFIIVLVVVGMYFHSSYSMALPAYIVGHPLTLSESFSALKGQRWILIWAVTRLTGLLVIIALLAAVPFIPPFVVMEEANYDSSWLTDIYGLTVQSVVIIAYAGLQAAMYKRLGLPINTA